MENNIEVEDIQFDVNVETIEEIKKMLGDNKDKVQYTGSHGNLIFTILGNKTYKIFPTEWIVKDNYFFVISNDIFQQMLQYLNDFLKSYKHSI